MAKSVLIVDDLAFVRKTLSEILISGHYVIAGEAADGFEAIAAYQRLKPDVVTLDMVMPGMSGLEAARRILKINKAARIVVISALGQESLVMEAISVGARDYVVKPFSATDILHTIERALLDDETAASRPLTREPKAGTP